MIKNIYNLVVNMSLTASIVIVIIAFVRWLIGSRMPKVFNFSLWAIVAIRLLAPIKLMSSVSIFNAIPNPLTENTINILNNNTVNSAVANTANVIYNNQPSINKGQLLSLIWFIGFIVLLLVSVYTYLKISRKLNEAIIYNRNDLVSICCNRLNMKRRIKLFSSSYIKTPVVYGLIKPRIIIPNKLIGQCSDSELQNIIMHELVHIKRYDYLTKPLFMFAVCLHWFNPVVWISFILAQKDMEISCDERVMISSSADIRTEYASTLVKLATNKTVLLNGGLLAFGESNIKDRITGIMKFKKPSKILGITTLLALFLVSSVLLTNGLSNQAEHSQIDDQVKNIAWAFVNKDIENYELSPDVKIIDSKITRLEKLNSYVSSKNDEIDVYRLKYRLKPEDLSKLNIEQGMKIDKDGWITEERSMGSPILVISGKDFTRELMGVTWTLAIDEEGMETTVKKLIASNE